jgi:hypothetical protein
VFVPGKPFQPSLLFVSKAGTFQVLHSRVGFWTYRQTLDKAEKHSNLLQKFVNYGQKKFYNIRPRAQCYKTFLSVLS